MSSKTYEWQSLKRDSSDAPLRLSNDENTQTFSFPCLVLLELAVGMFNKIDKSVSLVIYQLYHHLKNDRENINQKMKEKQTFPYYGNIKNVFMLLF